jgi:hypothetical protein
MDPGLKTDLLETVMDLEKAIHGTAWLAITQSRNPEEANRLFTAIGAMNSALVFARSKLIAREA